MGLFLCMVLDSVLTSFFTCSCPVFPARLNEETVFSSLYILASFVTGCLATDVLVYLWAFYLLHWSIFLFLCQYHTILMNSFVVEPEIRDSDSSSSISLYKLCLDFENLPGLSAEDFVTLCIIHRYLYDLTRIFSQRLFPTSKLILLF